MFAIAKTDGQTLKCLRYRKKSRAGGIDITFTDRLAVVVFVFHFSCDEKCFHCGCAQLKILQTILFALRRRCFPFVFLLHRLFDFITLIKIDYNFFFSFHEHRTHTENHHINTENLALSSFTFFLFLFVASLPRLVCSFSSRQSFFLTLCVCTQWHGFEIKFNLHT